MKKFVVFAAMMALVAAMPVHAQTLTKVGVGIEQILGASAAYNAVQQKITWSGGIDGWLLTDSGYFSFFSELPNYNSVPVSATFTLMTDLSSGGQAKARFASSAWNIDLIAGGSSVAYIAGHISGSYNEVEVDPDMLEGRAVVIVDVANFDEAYWEAILGEGQTLGWEGIGLKAGIIANITLPYETGIEDYSEDYASDNVIVTLYADEGVIPEPATIALLSLGGLLLRKRS